MKYVYEFIGTFFLVFTVGMLVVYPDTANILAPLAIGSALAVMVYAGGHISGGHYNPAVSLAVYLRGKLSLENLGLYWITQLVAGVAAALVTIYFSEGKNTAIMDLSVGKALVAEFLFAFALCFVVLNVATARATEGNSYFGLAIGFTVLVGAFSVGDISGAAFNPAVALGLAVMNVFAWSSLWIFVVANLLGAAAAAVVFKAAHPNE